MPEMLIKLTPIEPYFFGGERIFEIGDGNKHYFIRSLNTPAQSALFGVLRYLAILNPKSTREFKNDYDNYAKKRASGEFKREFQGYALNRPDVQFEKIHGISPLYLVDENDCFYAPLPFDHRLKCVDKDNNEVEKTEYTPFERYSEPIKTSEGERRLPLGYNAKDGLVEGWVALDGTRKIRTNLFSSVPQVGIDKFNVDKAFYKKEYKRLEKGFSFAFFADIDMPLYNHLVYIGQGKSPFRAVWQEMEEPVFPEGYLRKGMVYAQSDIYYTGDIKTLYSGCLFVCAKTRGHRIFKENYLDRKGSGTVRLIRAGSVFWPDDAASFAKQIQNEHAAVAGFNKIIIGGKTQ